MADIVDFDAPYYGPVTPEKILQGALAKNLREVVVIGETQDGTVYLSSTTGEAQKVYWLCACAKKLTMEACFIEVEE